MPEDKLDLFKQNEAVRLGVTVEQVKQLLEVASAIDSSLGFSVSSYYPITSVVERGTWEQFSQAAKEAAETVDLWAVDMAVKRNEPESQTELCNRLIKDLHKRYRG
jgi:hypothetical protein